MGFFDFLKASKKENEKTIHNSIGKFSYIDSTGTKVFTGIINSKIGHHIELQFITDAPQISNYQMDYFKRIENDWSSIMHQIQKINPKIDFEKFKVVFIMMPDQGDSSFDCDAEIVLQWKDFIISAILVGVHVDQLEEN